MLDPKILNKEGDKPITLVLTSGNDGVFKDIRDINFGVLRNLLTNKVSYIQNIIDVIKLIYLLKIILLCYFIFVKNYIFKKNKYNTS